MMAFNLRDAWRRFWNTNVVPLEDHIEAKMQAAEAITQAGILTHKLGKCERQLESQRQVAASYKRDYDRLMAEKVCAMRGLSEHPLAVVMGEALPGIDAPLTPEEKRVLVSMEATDGESAA